jgi:cytidylate kinase
MMNQKIVIAINREYGSGGRTIGEMLARELNIGYYDKDIYKMASEVSGINEALFVEASEDFRGTPLFRSSDPYTGSLIGPESSEFTSRKNLFAYQAKTIKALSEKEACVIVGKAAGFVLKNEPNLVRVFVHAPYWFLRQEAAKRNSLTDKELNRYIEKENKRRADYNYYYTGEKWDDAHNYDLCVDASKLGFEKCVKIIEGYMKVRFDGLQF